MLALPAFLFENTNSARKAWRVKEYTQQQLNRRHKPHKPMIKLKEAEFWYMLEGNYIEVQSYLKISQNMAKLLD